MQTKIDRILIIDDDIEDQLLIKRAFRETSASCELHVLEDGESAVAHLIPTELGAAAMHPDLILLDLNMPRMDGREVLATLREYEHLRRIPVIVFTTSSARDDVDSCYDLGARSYIQKPSTFTELKQAISEITRYWLSAVELPLRGAAP